VATELAGAGNDVAVIDVSRRAFERLGGDFPGQVVLGSGTDQEVLEQAGADKADCFISVTNGDNRNIMSAQIAREIFSIPRVMTRIKDPIRAKVYQEIGLYTYCPTEIGVAIARTFFASGKKEPKRRLPAAQGMPANV
jgi:trk system potassium uptake protein TrkA